MYSLPLVYTQITMSEGLWRGEPNKMSRTWFYVDLEHTATTDNNIATGGRTSAVCYETGAFRGLPGA